LLTDAPARARMGHAAAHSARVRFDRERNIGELYAWCAEVASRWSA
jgi:hypothetical protein